MLPSHFEDIRVRGHLLVDVDRSSMESNDLWVKVLFFVTSEDQWKSSAEGAESSKTLLGQRPSVKNQRKIFFNKLEGRHVLILKGSFRINIAE